MEINKTRSWTLVGDFGFRVESESRRNIVLACLVIKTHSIFFAQGLNFIIKFVNVWNASYFLSIFVSPFHEAEFALIFIRSLGLNGGIMLPAFHTYFHPWSFECIWYDREHFSYSSAIKMFPLAHAFVIVWWKFTALADVSTGKMCGVLLQRSKGLWRWSSQWTWTRI